jgi:protein-S-isoprenylcysteine O-methyltransferase Ste14
MVATSLAYWFAPVVRLSLFSCHSCGVAALTAGFGVMMWAWSEFRQKKNPICPTATAVTLVRSGPFRFSRNPMYLGMESMLLAPLLWSGSLSFFLPPAVFFGIIHFIFIPYEEERLEHTFKEDYGAYSAKVRRWI